MAATPDLAGFQKKLGAIGYEVWHSGTSLAANFIIGEKKRNL